jgi:hypothetical protein
MACRWTARRRSQTRIEENHTARHDEKVRYLAIYSSGRNRRARYRTRDHTAGRCSFLKFVRTARAANKETSEISRLITSLLRFNEPIPLHIHDTLSLPYMQNSLSSQFLSPDARTWKAERALECNVLLDVAPMPPLQHVAVLLKCRRKFAARHTAWFQNKGRALVF